MRNTTAYNVFTSKLASLLKKSKDDVRNCSSENEIGFIDFDINQIIPDYSGPVWSNISFVDFTKSISLADLMDHEKFEKTLLFEHFESITEKTVFNMLVCTLNGSVFVIKDSIHNEGFKNYLIMKFKYFSFDMVYINDYFRTLNEKYNDG